MVIDMASTSVSDTVALALAVKIWLVLLTHHELAAHTMEYEVRLGTLTPQLDNSFTQSTLVYTYYSELPSCPSTSALSDPVFRIRLC